MTPSRPQPSPLTAHRVLLTDEASILSVNWSPDGPRLAVGAGEGRVEMWEAVSGQLLFSCSGHDHVYGISWSPDGRGVAAGGDDKITTHRIGARGGEASPPPDSIE
jgi:WD40 repeat protein